MDPSLYKDLKTSRGFNYHYYRFVSDDNSKPTLLLLHGFPSLSQDWSHVVQHFQSQNYGIIVPDLLGYGGTDKPTDATIYRMKLMSRDVIEILDNENERTVIAIGHDWGAGLLSRLAVYYPERFTAYAFLALSYFPPTPKYDIDALNAASIDRHGYANFGYWKFFVKDEAPKLIGQHLKSFFTLVYGSGGRGLGKIFSDVNTLEKWLVDDQLAPSILDDKTLQDYIEIFGRYGFAAPLCWYKAFVFNHTPNDDAEISKDRYVVTKPVFFGAALDDTACRADHGKEVTSRYCPNATVFEYNTGHWILQQAPEKLNEDIQTWLHALHSNEAAKL